MNSLNCVFCNVEENVTHLFLHSGFSFQMWNRVFGWLGVSIVQHNEVQSHYMQHDLIFKGKRLCHFC